LALTARLPADFGLALNSIARASHFT